MNENVDMKNNFEYDDSVELICLTEGIPIEHNAEIVRINVLDEQEIINKYLDKYTKMLKEVFKKFSDKVFSNKWTKISDKNCWYNNEIKACYPDFHNNYQKIRIKEYIKVSEVLKIIKNNEEYQKYGIEWDVQTYKESINSFYNKWHPMEIEEYKKDHSVITWRGLTYKNGESMRSYNNDPGELGSMDGGLLIPIFRLGDSEDYSDFEKDKEKIVKTSRKKMLLKFIKNNFIPDVIKEDNDIFKSFQILHEDFQVYIDYIKIDEESKSDYYKWDFDKLYKDIVENSLGGDLVNNIIIELEFDNGEREIKNYISGKATGESVLYSEDGTELKRYWYENDEKRDITAMRKILDVDKKRVNLSSYDENILADPNRGHWDLFGVEDIEDIEAGVGRKIYRRDPKKDIKRGGIVGIDFGTKSTVVVFQDDNNRTLPMRISGGNLVSEVKKDDYENPTVIEFRDIESFMKDYNAKEGRPLTKWEDVTVSHTAFQNLINGTSDEFYSIISDLKQWAGVKNEKIVIRDKKGVETLFPPYMELEEGEKDPIELYAYYIGSYINNMINGIYLEYLLSFPVTYEKKIREKILQSFERGIKKSFPVAIIEDEETMKRFKVIHGANEPAAYAACALQEYGFEPDDDEIVYYGVFDFGGGTADFDFGIWKASEDERNFDYELTHFGAGGDRYLGGENILKELAYEILKENQEILRKEKISFARPVWCERFVGDEGLVDNSPEGKLNIKMLMEKLRPFWENSSETNNDDGKLKANLYSKDGMLKTGVELKISKEVIDNLIESKIERGIENFFIALDKAMKDEEVDKINILLAGNSCKHPKVMELFEKYKDDFKGEIEIFPALGTDEAYAKMEELGLDTDSEDKTKPTGKTGVAYGIIDSRIGGRIDVKNRDEENNLNNEINFRYYVGYEGRKKLRVVLGPQTQYDKFVYYLDALPMFDIYYTSLPEAMESKMPIAKAKRKRIYLKDEYPGAKIYIKSVSPDTIKYAISEKDIEEKEYLEEGTIELD